MVPAGVIAGRAVMSSGRKGYQMALSLGLVNSFCTLMWHREVPISPISSSRKGNSLYEMVMTVATVRTGWQLPQTPEEQPLDSDSSSNCRRK